MYAVLNNLLNCSHIKNDALSILFKWSKFPKRWRIVNKRVLTFRLSDNVKFSPWYHKPANNLVAGQSVIDFYRYQYSHRPVFTMSIWLYIDMYRHLHLMKWCLYKHWHPLDSGTTDYIRSQLLHRTCYIKSNWIKPQLGQNPVTYFA